MLVWDNEKKIIVRVEEREEEKEVITKPVQPPNPKPVKK